MTTKNLISKLEAKTFDADMDAVVREEYECMAQKGGTYEPMERDYAAAKQALTDILTDDQNNTVVRYEQIAAERAHHAVKYGFTAGMVCGVQLYHSVSHGISVDAEIMLESLAIDQKSETDAKAQAQAAECLAIDNKLQHELSSDLYEHIISVTCAWDERIHFSRLYGLYIGYRVSLAMLRVLYPTNASVMEPSTLALEHALGLI